MLCCFVQKCIACIWACFSVVSTVTTTHYWCNWAWTQCGHEEELLLFQVALLFPFHGVLHQRGACNCLGSCICFSPIQNREILWWSMKKIRKITTKTPMCCFLSWFSQVSSGCGYDLILCPHRNRSLLRLGRALLKHVALWGLDQTPMGVMRMCAVVHCPGQQQDRGCNVLWRWSQQCPFPEKISVVQRERGWKICLKIFAEGVAVTAQGLSWSLLIPLLRKLCF